ncbi:MAG: hypothetical protein R2788_25770 [Saprospiraceae bacterium]
MATKTGTDIKICVIRLVGIGLNMGLNAFWPDGMPVVLKNGYNGDFIEAIYNPSWGIKYISFQSGCQSGRAFTAHP